MKLLLAILLSVLSLNAFATDSVIVQQSKSNMVNSVNTAVIPVTNINVQVVWNGITNNFVQGSNITISVTSSNVTISAAGGGDFKSDGSVSMTGDINCNNNGIGNCLGINSGGSDMALTAVGGTGTLNLNASLISTTAKISAGGLQITSFASSVIHTGGADYTVLDSDSFVLVDAAGGTIRLLDATTCAGKEVTVKMVDSGSCSVVDAASGNIDGASSYSIAAQYDFVTFKSDGVQWWVLNSGL